MRHEGERLMIIYLLVLSDDGDDSYSLWASKQSAEGERDYIIKQTGLSMLAFDIIPMEVNP